MSIKPIDLQVNMNSLYSVSKNQTENQNHLNENAMLNYQKNIKETQESNRQVNNISKSQETQNNIKNSEEQQEKNNNKQNSKNNDNSINSNDNKTIDNEEKKSIDIYA